MNTLLYEPVVDERSKILLYRIIENLNLESRLEVHRTIGSLSSRLCQLEKGLTVAVLFTTSKEALFDILSIKDLLFDIPIILILPDREEDTIAKGHILRPRFLTYADSDFGEIPAVLKRMLDANYPERNDKRSSFWQRNTHGK